MVDTTPTEAGFQAFMADPAGMGIPSAAMPIQSTIDTAYCFAKATVNCQLRIIPVLYTAAVYNLAGSFLVNVAQDPSGSPTWPGSNPPLTYWAGLRASFNTNSFTAGVISASNDDTTGQSMTIGDNLTNLTMADLQNLKNPFGRAYMQIAMDAGSLWGLS